VILIDSNIIIDARDANDRGVAILQSFRCRIFFIGAHAELMGWKLATRDTERF